MKILILGNATRQLILFRGDLIKEIIEREHEVHACAPEPDEDNAIAAMGAHFHQLPMSRAGTNPFADIKLMRNYKKLIRDIKPDVLFCYTIKPNVYGGWAGKKQGVSRIVLMVEGLGNAFVQSAGIKRKLLRKLLINLYRRAGKVCDRMIFLNLDDQRDFVNFKIIPKEKASIVNGIGVNMEHYQPSPLPSEPVFLMVSRLLREKGVMIYLEAASIIKQKYPHVRMLLVGPYENNSFAVTEDDIRPYIERGAVEYFGAQKDVRPFYAQASVVVLPSYREGVPRTLLEAMACQRAVITTDVPGCREAVIHGETGLLIPPRDVNALASAMGRLLINSEEVVRMGRAGFAYCAEKYEITKINTRIIALLGL